MGLVKKSINGNYIRKVSGLGMDKDFATWSGVNLMKPLQG